MGEAQKQPFQLSFNPALKVEFQGSRVTSDGGLILVRELDQRLGLSDLIAQHFPTPTPVQRKEGEGAFWIWRRGSGTEHPRDFSVAHRRTSVLTHVSEMEAAPDES